MIVRHIVFFSLFSFSNLIVCKQPGRTDQQAKVQVFQPELQSYLDSLESIFTKVPEWLTTVYDSTSGGFYDNALMVKDPRFGPDLQSTRFALHVLFDGNIISKDSVSTSLKGGLINFVKSRYDTSVGYYLDPPYRKKMLQNERTLSRAQGMATGILNEFDVQNQEVKPFGKTNTPEHLRSLSQFKIWFKNQAWDRVWTAFDNIAMEVNLIKRLPSARADSIIQYIRGYVVEIQDKDGLWGKGQPDEVRFSGAAKYGTFCLNTGIPMPKPDRIYETVVEWLRTNQELDFSKISGCPICVPRNALRLLFYVKPGVKKEISSEDQLLIAKRTFEMLRFYHREDGGFMKTQTAAVIAPDDINLGKYDAQISDMNGTNLAITARAALYNLLDMPVPYIKNSIRF